MKNLFRVALIASSLATGISSADDVSIATNAPGVFVKVVDTRWAARFNGWYPQVTIEVTNSSGAPIDRISFKTTFIDSRGVEKYDSYEAVDDFADRRTRELTFLSVSGYSYDPLLDGMNEGKNVWRYEIKMDNFTRQGHKKVTEGIINYR